MDPWIKSGGDDSQSTSKAAFLPHVQLMSSVVDAPSPVLFEAVITPHRSLGRRGLRNLVVALVLLSALVAVGLFLAGAWPVIGFTGIEAALAIWLLYRHAAVEGEAEMLILSDHGLHVVKTTRGRRTELKLPVAWLRAGLEERPGRTPALMLRGGDRSA